MKLKQHQPLTQQQISEYQEMNREFERTNTAFRITIPELTKPNPPTPEAIERAKFVDKTYVWLKK